MNTGAGTERLSTSRIDRAFVFGQLGQTLDGRIACHNGASKYINGSDALDHLHGLRADADAVVVGVGTVIADDPRLTVRRCTGETPQAIVIDPHRRMPSHARLFTVSDQPPLFIRHESDVRSNEDIGVASFDGNGTLDPIAIVAALCERGHHQILVEGGALTLSHFINRRAIDRLHILMAPIILGSGITGLNLRPIDSIDEALRPETRLSQFPDGDVLYECRLKSVWSR